MIAPSKNTLCLKHPRYTTMCIYDTISCTYIITHIDIFDPNSLDKIPTTHETFWWKEELMNQVIISITTCWRLNWETAGSMFLSQNTKKIALKPMVYRRIIFMNILNKLGNDNQTLVCRSSCFEGFLILISGGRYKYI